MKAAEKADLLNFKFIIVGDSGVGKSSMLIRYSKNEFAVDYNATIGVEFQSKIVKVNDVNVKLQIWDTAGQESFRSIVKSFYKKSVGVLIVYNTTNWESFASVKHWLREARENAEESAIFGLVGAQCDRESERKVTREDAIKLQNQEKFDLFFEISSKENVDVDRCFQELAKMAFLKKVNSQLLRKSFQDSSFLSSNDQGKQTGVSQNNSNTRSIPLRDTQVEKKKKKSGTCC